MLRLALAGFAGDDLTKRADMARLGARVAIRRGDAVTAGALVRTLQDRDSLTEILTDRAFAAFWPEIEAYAGPGMARAENETIAQMRQWAALSVDIDGVAEQRGLARAYFLAGRFAEANALLAPFATTPEAISQIGEDGAWLINDHASMLNAMGRFDDADRRIAALRIVPIKQAPWQMNMIINRVEWLLLAGRWEQAAPLAEEAHQLSQTYGSLYARQLTLRMRICVALRRDPRADLAAMVTELVEHDDDARSATIDGLLCAHRDDEAAERLIAWLNSGKDVSSAIEALQDPASRRVTDPSIWGADWQKLLQRPTVRAAFEKVGRQLPKAFWPAAKAPN